MSEDKRQVAKLKRQIASAMNELANIQNMARNAKGDPGKYLGQLKGMFSSLDGYYSKYESAFDELFVLGEESENVSFPSEEDKKNRGIMRSAFYEIKTIYIALTETPPIQPGTVTNTSLNESGLNCSTIVHENSMTHLPEIKLEKFDGEIMNWPKFRDAFLSIVDESKSLSPTKKFHYLRTSVTGPALSMISKFQISDVNYTLAWKALCEAYDKKRLLATAYLNRVLNFPPFESKPTIESLKYFMTTVSDSISAFEMLGIESESKFILFHLAFRLLDQATREQFQNANKNTEFPCFDDLSTFIKDKCFSMQLSTDTNMTFDRFSSSSKQGPKVSRNKYSDKKGPNANGSFGKSSLVANQSKPQPTPTEKSDSPSATPCFLCHESPHRLASCRKFCGSDLKQRLAWLTNWKGCRSCLSDSHSTQDCRSKWNCRWCKERHNSLICENDGKNKLSITKRSNPGTCAISGTYKATNEDSLHPQVILGTCLAEVLDARGTYQTVRLVVDSASHYSFMTNKCANRLGFEPKKCSLTISGIGEGNEGIRGFVSCLIKPVNKSAPHLSLKALLLKTITSQLPTVTLPRKLWIDYIKFPLADPKFFERKPIDILLGADLFCELWLGTPITINSNSPKLFPTVFGHVVIGKYSEPDSDRSQPIQGTSLIAAIGETNTLSDLNSNLQRFWEIEEPKPARVSNPEDDYCEDHFIQTHYRLDDGSYGVRLPFRSSPPEFSDSQSIALKRFRHQENRLLKNSDLREKYCDFMEQYKQLGHMSVSSNAPAYVIPHHHVSKVDRNELKIRVVFDGSAQSISSQSSLNSCLMVGRKLQTDIRDLLLNFRVHKVALIADCVKMFRGIWVHPDDRKYQTIYWRSNPYDVLQLYELNTVTYGLTSSPYQANRVVRKIVEDYGSDYPEASEVLYRDIYVDDIVSGSNTIENAKLLQQQLIDLLGKGNLKLSKWASNEPELLKTITENSDSPVSITPSEDTSVKILGLQWNPKNDCFGYTLNLPMVKPTKRSILSNVARIYDPLGFISPLVVIMKKFIQDSWKMGLNWDQPVPNELADDWDAIMKQLHIISNLNIPRFVSSTDTAIYQIVGFSDASEIAYSAALYLRVITPGNIKTSLLTAKTKLAPLKSLTIPRLELLGCFLLARLYKSISQFIDLLKTPNLISPFFFSDSTIALGWLRTPTYKLKTFVCNRVSEILQITNEDQWRHVSSLDNPADVGSRGLLPQELLDCEKWWNGPHWLSLPDSEWPTHPIIATPDLPDMKKERAALIAAEPSMQNRLVIELIDKVSSFNRLLRILAHILRFVHNLRDKMNRRKGPLRLEEIRSAQNLCVKTVQLQEFFKNDLSEKNQARILKKFINLNPFFDSSGILRAGGRLHNANLPYNHRHPQLLPPDNRLTIMIVDHFHRMYLHPGPVLLQAVVQLEFWIPSLRRLARRRVFSCTRCYRLKGKTFIPKMADLPPHRVRAARAFLKTGLDFAGPFYMKDSLRRKSSVSKVYICIFVCMVTKAIHIEAVTSLSADAFLASLDRFVSLRGLPTDLYSDCGSNFVSAARQLKEWYKWWTCDQTQLEISDKITMRQINWHFNPPHAPHFGGIWESGVKSAKSLMIRTVGDVTLTYEELATLTAKISAVLNSRPISPLSNDPTEIEYLSPGHFLVGEAPLAIPEPALLDVAMNRLDRWQLVKRLSQHFWDRWHKEYLSSLQKRNKWRKDGTNLKVGDLVFIKDDNQSILQWARGRIIEVTPGKDGKVRVATVKTANSVYSRPVAKLVPLLPPEDDELSSYQPPEEERKSYNKWIDGTIPCTRNVEELTADEEEPTEHGYREDL